MDRENSEKEDLSSSAQTHISGRKMKGFGKLTNKQEQKSRCLHIHEMMLNNDIQSNWKFLLRLMLHDSEFKPCCSILLLKKLYENLYKIFGIILNSLSLKNIPTWNF